MDAAHGPRASGSSPRPSRPRRWAFRGETSPRRPVPAGSAPRGLIYPLLLVSILVMGVASMGVAELWHTRVKREKEEELLFRLNQFRWAIAQYRAERNRYPRELKDLLEDRSQFRLRRYLRRIYKDPITGKDDWRLVLVMDRAGVVSGISDIKSRAEGKPLKSIVGKKDTYQDW